MFPACVRCVAAHVEGVTALRQAGVMQSMPPGEPELVHICSVEEWALAGEQGEHRPTSLAETGFVHLSEPCQVHLPANRLYRGRCDLVVLSVALNMLDSPVRWEPGVPSDPESMLFPHLYGPLPIAAVTSVANFRPGPDGFFEPLAPKHFLSYQRGS